MKISMKKYLDFIEHYPVRQAPRAAQFIVNQMAFEARMIAVKIVDKKYILRNRFVTGRIQFQTAQPNANFSEIKSKMGALKEIDFMADQEEGFILRPTKGRKLPIPTRAARIGKSIEKRKRAVYRENQLGTLRRISGYKGKSKRQKIIAMLQDMARRKDKKPALIPFPNKPGIYVLKNIRARRKQSKYTFRLHKLYDLSKSSQRIKPRPWMKPTLEKVSKLEGKIAEVAWQRFLSRI